MLGGSYSEPLNHCVNYAVFLQITHSVTLHLSTLKYFTKRFALQINVCSAPIHLTYLAILVKF